MKRERSLKRRARISDSTDVADHSVSAVIDRRDGSRRKPLDSRDQAAGDGPWTSDWDGTALEFLERQPRR